MNNLSIEKYYPITVSIITTCILAFLDCGIGLIHNFIRLDSNVFEVSVAVGSLFAGFVSLSRDAIRSCQDPLINKVLKSSYGKVLNGYIRCSIIASVCFVVISFCLLVLKDEILQEFFCYAFCLWFFFLLYMILTFIRNHLIISQVK